MSKKSKRKNKIILVIVYIFTLLIGLAGGILIGKFVLKEKEKECPLVDPMEREYLTVDNQKVYLINLNELDVNLDNQKMTLKEFIKSNNNDLEKSLNKLEKYLTLRMTLRDGGTKIYDSKNSDLFNRDITIIKCNTTDGNKDYYFGTSYDTTEAFKNGACGKNFFDNQEFTRVYTIEKITKVKDNLYKIKITDGNKEIEIERTLSAESRSILKENQEFIFYFYNKYKELIKEDIEEIFDKCELTGVVPNEVN